MTLKTLFIITVSTARLVFPGVPAFQGANEPIRPPATKSLSLEVASDYAADKGSKASVAVPQGLKSGKAVDLQVDLSARPAPAPADASVTVSQYWGSSREVASDQPRNTHPSAESASGLPTKSYASWPTDDSKPLPDEVALAGDYSLTTNYCGSTAVTLSKEQEFLAPISLTGADSEPNLGKPITVKWKQVPNAVGYILKAYGGQAGKSVTWTSAAKPDLAEGIEYKPLGKDEVDSLIKAGALIPSYAVTATIPAGIFKDSPSVMLIVTAFGKDLDQTKDGIETQVIVRSTTSMPLHSSPMVPPQKPKNADRKEPTDD